MTDRLKALHDCYSKLTLRSPHFQTWERAWYEYDKAGYTQDDLITTVCFMLNSNRKHDWKYSLALHKLIGDLERFDDLLCEARAKNRNRIQPPSARENILQAFRGSAEKESQPLPQSVKDVLKRAIE